MKKLITFLIAGLFTLASYGQSGVAHYTGIKLGDGAGATTAYNLVSTAEYTIQKVGSTYYARPGIGTGYTAYSSANLKTMMDQVQAALTTGGTIFIKAGLYDGLDVGAITVVNDNIKIVGAGKYLTILKLKASADIGVIVRSGLVICAGNDNFTISDLEIDGNGANQTIVDSGASTTAVINGINGSNPANTTNNLTVHDCYIHDCTMFGIYVGNANDGNIYNNIVKDNYWNNITIAYPVSRCRVDNNYCSGSADVSITCYGDDCTISNNTILDVNGTHGSFNSRYGIAFEGPTGFPKRSKIIGNIITGATTLCGIRVTNGSTDCEISDNKIFDLTAGGFNTIGINTYNSTYLKVSGNMIFRVADMGIDINATTYSLFLNNDISQMTSGWGIYAEGNSTYNRIIGNDIGSNKGLKFVSGSNSNYTVGNIIKGSSNLDFIDLAASNIYDNNYSIYGAKWIQATGAVNNTATATTGGLTTGIIAAGSQNLTVTSNTNDSLKISLPAASAATIGTRITGLLVGAKICELRVQAAQATTVYINGVTTNVEAALPAACNFEVTQVDATHWILKAWTALGAVITAIVPDAV